MRGAVRRGELGVVAEPVLHLLHQPGRPRACRSARPRAGRSGRRSSGTACRRAAAARWSPRRGCRTGSGGRPRAMPRGVAARAGAAIAASSAGSITRPASLRRVLARPGVDVGRRPAACPARRVAGQLDRRPTRRSHHAVGVARRARRRGRAASASRLERLAVLVEHDVATSRRASRSRTARGPAPRRRPGRPSAASRARGRRCRPRAAAICALRSAMCARCWR